MSFLSGVRKFIHTTPVLRQVSKSYAETFGMSKAYAEFDAKIGYTEDGSPTPAPASYSGFGEADLANYIAQKSSDLGGGPGVTMMVDQYRAAQGFARQYSVGRVRPPYVPMPAQIPGELADEDDLVDEDLVDDEEEG